VEASSPSGGRPSPTAGLPFVLEPVDLLLLSVKAPLADAVSATVCARWLEATDLWLDVYRQPAYRTMAALCGLEAALRAGLYDLAQYFHIGLGGTPASPDFLAEAWRESLPIRRDRARRHGERSHAASRAERLRLAQRLVELRFYREAIRETFRARLLQTDGRAAVALLAECYSRLGEHETLIGLQRSQPRRFNTAALRAKARSAQEAMQREALGPVQNALEFAGRHPAGPMLEPFLMSPRSVFARHG
jgi:hypothetical protein